MTSTLFRALIGVALLIPLILIASNGWSWWYLVLAAVLLAVVAALRIYAAFRSDRQASLVESLESSPSLEAPAPPSQDTIAEVDLPTNTPDYRMLFSAHVMWRLASESNPPSHGDPGALAKQSIIERAVAVVRDALPVDVTITRIRLAAVLGEWQSDPTGQVRACANEVKLEMRDEDVDRLRARSDLRKKSQVWEQERELERNVRDYLASDVLTTTGRALVWWMARHIDDIEGAVALIGHLSRLSAVSQDRQDTGLRGPSLVGRQAPTRDSEDLDTILTVELLNQLFPNSPAQRVLFALQLAQTAERCGQERYGRRLREIVGVDMPDVPPGPDEEEPTGT